MFEPVAADLPTVRYFLIFSRRFGPIPRMAIRSLTLLKAPSDLRICRIFAAVDGPMPGTSCSWGGVRGVDVDGLREWFFGGGGEGHQ